MKALGGVITMVGYFVFVVTSIWGFLLCLAIISDAAGFWGLVISLFVAPITFVAAPWYAGFAWDNWFPLILEYGGGVTAFVLIGVGGVLSGDS